MQIKLGKLNISVMLSISQVPKIEIFEFMLKLVVQYMKCSVSLVETLPLTVCTCDSILQLIPRLYALRRFEGNNWLQTGELNREMWAVNKCAFEPLFLSLYQLFLKDLFIYGGGEGQSEREREAQAGFPLSAETDSRLDPRTPRPRPEWNPGVGHSTDGASRRPSLYQI